MILVRKPKEINLKHLPGYNQCFRGIRYDPQCPMCLCFLYQNMSKIRFDLTQRKRRDPYKIRLINTTHFYLASFQPLLKSSQMFSSFYSPVVVNIIWIVSDKTFFAMHNFQCF